MSHDLIRRVEAIGRPRVLVVGDLILDRYVWGYAERISQEAPVPLLRADHREHRLGGAASVATMLKALGAEVCLVGTVGRDAESVILRKLLAELDIDDRLVFSLEDRPTTLKERYIGRAQDRHPQQMIRVDYEVRDPIPQAIESVIWEHIPESVGRADVVLISDYDKGVCTPSLLRSITTACRSLDVRLIVDPIRSASYDKYQGAHCMTPNRLEAQLATGLTIKEPADALEVGRALVRDLRLECALVTLDRDGMAMVHSDGRELLLPTRPRQVYDITGAGDMVLSVVGLCLAAGADYDEAAALGNVAGGLEVEKLGVALLTRQELLRDILDHHHPEASKLRELPGLVDDLHRRRQAGQTVVYTEGRFDVLTPGQVRLLRAAAAEGDFLVVGLRADPAGGPASLEARAEVLGALEAVDAVVRVDDDNAVDLIQTILPDTLVKEGQEGPEDQAVRALLEEAGGRVIYVNPLKDQAATLILKEGTERTLRIHSPSAAVRAPFGRQNAPADPSRPLH